MECIVCLKMTCKIFCCLTISRVYGIPVELDDDDDDLVHQPEEGEQTGDSMEGQYSNTTLLNRLRVVSNLEVYMNMFWENRQPYELFSCLLSSASDTAEGTDSNQPKNLFSSAKGYIFIILFMLCTMKSFWYFIALLKTLSPAYLY